MASLCVHCRHPAQRHERGVGCDCGCIKFIADRRATMKIDLSGKDLVDELSPWPTTASSLSSLCRSFESDPTEETARVLVTKTQASIADGTLVVEEPFFQAIALMHANAPSSDIVKMCGRAIVRVLRRFSNLRHAREE